MSYVTYAHIKPNGSMFYIGKGSMRRAHSAVGRNVIWERTVKKHGGFSVEILGNWELEQEAFDHEIDLIRIFRGMGASLVNIADGGMGSKGFRHTDEHKATMSKKWLEKNPMDNPEIRAKQLYALRLAMARPEVRQRQSESRIGMKLSDSHISSLKKCHPTKPCVVNGVEYPSLMEASRLLGIRHGTLHRWLNCSKIIRGAKYQYIKEVRWL